MKITKENMQGLAERLDRIKPPTLEEAGVTVDDVMNMAYVLEAVFQARDEIAKQHNKFSVQYLSRKFDDATFGVASGLFKAWDLLKTALADT